MPPNFNDVSDPSAVNFEEGSKNSGPPHVSGSSTEHPAMVLVRSLATLVAYTIIGILVGVIIVFGLRNDLNATNLHVMLCVIGFQFLMGQAILSLAPGSIVSGLSLKRRRWLHWALQILGSLLALTGCFIKIMDKDVHWNTIHGRCALVAIVFTTVSLVNGLASMYAHQLRRVVPGILSRLTHVLFGIIAMTFACTALSFGMDKGFFRAWAGTELADALIALNSILNAYIIISPCVTFFTKLCGHFRK